MKHCRISPSPRILRREMPARIFPCTVCPDWIPFSGKTVLPMRELFLSERRCSACRALPKRSGRLPPDFSDRKADSAFCRAESFSIPVFHRNMKEFFRLHGSRFRELTLQPSQHNGEPLPRFCDILYPLHQKHKIFLPGAAIIIRTAVADIRRFFLC